MYEDKPTDSVQWGKYYPFYTTGRMTDAEKFGMLYTETMIRKDKRDADYEGLNERILSLSAPSA